MNKRMFKEIDWANCSRFSYRTIISTSVIVILFGLITGFSIWGNIQKKALTETKTVQLEDVKEVPYQMAPYHRGQIYTEYWYIGTYSYEIDGVHYKVEIEGRSKAGGSVLPKTIVVRYDPFNSCNQMVDKDDNPELGRLVKIWIGRDGRDKADE